jgi:tetratricopeptide (TPR) repeat protein
VGFHGQRLAFHPDGDLITADSNMIVREYPLAISELMAFARRHVSRSWTADECLHYLHEEHCQSETVALAHIAEGNNLSRVGKDSAAMASFRKAQEIDPSLQLDAKEEIRVLRTEALLANGRNLASVGDWNDALTSFQKALELDPELHFNPQEAARHLAAPALAGKGRNLARAGDRNGAIASFREANELDPGLSFAPEAEADKWRANALNHLCWNGSVRGQAARVIDYCELAVQLSGTNDWDIRDSRGFARALTGNTQGAIEDFQFFADHTTNPVRKAQRQKWIDALNRGANPFTPEELKTLINQ